MNGTRKKPAIRGGLRPFRRREAGQSAAPRLVSGATARSVTMDMGPVVETHNRCAFELANEA
jgi:hypothetical protein